MADIRASYGGSTIAFDVMLRTLLLLDPLDYTPDLTALVETGGGVAMWDMTRIKGWAAAAFAGGPGADNQDSGAPAAPKLLAVWGRPGEGKSTLTAALLAAAGRLPPSVLTAAAGAAIDDAGFVIHVSVTGCVVWQHTLSDRLHSR
jgi:hypothetical protein